MWRYKKGHCLSHSQESGHCLALNFSDLSVWCYACDNYLDHAKLYPVKVGITSSVYQLLFLKTAEPGPQG